MVSDIGARGSNLGASLDLGKGICCCGVKDAIAVVAVAGAVIVTDVGISAVAIEADVAEVERVAGVTRTGAEVVGWAETTVPVVATDVRVEAVDTGAEGG